MKKFVIIGPQGSGKSTFGRILAEVLGTEFHETSEWLVKIEVARRDALKHRYGIRGLNDWDQERNRPGREWLVALGDAISLTMPGALTDWCFLRGDVCAGVRRHVELTALRTKYSGDLTVVYIDRPGGKEQGKDNFELRPADADLVLKLPDGSATSHAIATGIRDGSIRQGTWPK